MKRLLLAALLWASAVPAFAAEDPWRAIFAQSKTLSGQTLPSALAGRVVVVNVWATWCLPCIAEFPDLNGLVDRYGSEVVFLAITAEQAESIQGLLATKPFRYQQLVAGEEAIGQLVERLKAAGFEAQGNVRPLHAVIGPDGGVRFFASGFTTGIDQVLSREIDNALGRERKDIVRDTTVEPEAAAIVDRYLAAIGGVERLRAITTMRRVEAQTFAGKTSKVTTERDYSQGKVVSRVEVEPGFVMASGFDGERAWRVGMGENGYQKQDPAGATSRFGRKNPNLFLGFRDQGRGFRRGANSSDHLTVVSETEESPGVWLPVVYSFDSRSHLLVREVTGEGEGASVTEYSDYRTVSGVTLPHRVRTVQGELEIVRVIEEVVFDVTLDPAGFELPKGP